MIYEDWREDIKGRSIPMSASFRLEELLTNDVEIAKWAS
jgi:dynein heavy chain